AQERTIAVADLRDRIEAAWAGKMIGVAIGFPTEFKFRGELVPEDKFPQWKPAMLRDGLKQDDLYIQMTLAEALNEKGLDASTDDYGAKFRDSKYGLWHAHLAARRLMNRNISAKDAGSPVHNPHFNDISFQIDADFIGLMSPGMPNSAVEIARRAGVVIGWGQGIPAGGFMSGMYAASYFETDLRAVVEAGLKSIPSDCDYAQVIRDVLAMHAEDASDWQKTWRRINEKWDRDDVCPYGALMPLNIDARINGAYVAIGLLYGNGDFEKTIEIATRCGQDSDCNPSTAAGILGAMHGMKLLPATYLEELPAIRDEKFVYTQTSFNSIVENTLNRAIELAKRNGGRVEDEVLHIPVQSPKPIEMPTFDVGVPYERIVCTDSRWNWKGNWRDEVSVKSGPEKLAVEKGAEASIDFEGTGAIIVGPLLSDGGVAEVYIDGKLDRAVDVYSDEKLRKASDSVYHNFYLEPGKHTLRLVVRGEPYGASKGTDIRIMELTVLK
ncbi:MAG TPA: ADP-ribosylglycohydrolase family protein, partial [Chthoniobacterales bacterium]|nr:ADP-ribosylglycohydrolase family protein [Chthoniobacterales bacterium]